MVAILCLGSVTKASNSVDFALVCPSAKWLSDSGCQEPLSISECQAGNLSLRTHSSTDAGLMRSSGLSRCSSPLWSGASRSSNLSYCLKAHFLSRRREDACWLFHDWIALGSASQIAWWVYWLQLRCLRSVCLRRRGRRLLILLAL